ncbi:MerR family transcriptional regulator [Streptacidiphilus anmyonensis]|uniref:MerR family transcriptional regulator n=1 Tax=Streptacidiphilus anmyonensis TaxID=405782 RepID=UPI00069371BF|nr:MerR family transcriptional regulator [Streptacidiphilus anmyonensis]
MSDVMGRVPGPRREYLIDHLAQAAGTTVRNVRAYQDRGLLPRADRRGRANVYDDTHLDRLRLIAGLLDRGHTLAGIKELLDAWEDGRSLGGVLGLVAEVTAPWSDERPEYVERDDLTARFGGMRDPEAIAAAVRLGVLEPEPGPEQAQFPDALADRYRVPSPTLLDAAARLYELGVPLVASIAHLQEVRADMEHLARRFVHFAAVEVFPRYVGSAPLDDVDAARAAEAVRRMRPLAQAVVDAELARAMRHEATLLLEASVAPLPDPVREAVVEEL